MRSHSTDANARSTEDLSKDANARSTVDLVSPACVEAPCRSTLVTLKLSKKRWIVLLLFSITTLANSALFGTIPAINDIATRYYRVDPTVIDWLPSSFILIFMAVSFPTAYLMTTLGLRKCMITAACFNAVSTSLHFAGVARSWFSLVFAGQMFCALSAGMMLQAPPRLSTVWFAADEHATATSVAMFANIFGAGVGFLQPTHMVPSSTDMIETGQGLFNLYLSQLVFCVVNLLLVCVFFDEHPPYPPTYAALHTSNFYTVQHKGDNYKTDEEKRSPNSSYDGEHVSPDAESNMSLKTSLKILLTNKHTLLLSNGYGVYFALYCFLGVCLNQLVKSEVADTNLGWMGFSYNCFGIVGTMVGGILIDRFKCYKLVSVVLTLGSLLLWAAFSYLLLYVNDELSLFIVYSAHSVFGVPYFSVGVEQLAEATYPIPEGTSAAVAMTIGNTYSFVAIMVLGRAVDHGYREVVCYIVAGLYLLAFLMICAVRTDMRRQEEEAKHDGSSFPQIT